MENSFRYHFPHPGGGKSSGAHNLLQNPFTNSNFLNQYVLVKRSCWRAHFSRILMGLAILGPVHRFRISASWRHFWNCIGDNTSVHCLPHRGCFRGKLVDWYIYSDAWLLQQNSQPPVHVRNDSDLHELAAYRF